MVLFFPAAGARGQSPDTRPKGTGSISGRVTIGGKAVFGITVAALGGVPYSQRATQTTTDSEGRYRLFGLAAGTYQVTALAPALISADQANNYPYSGKTILLSTAEAVEDVDLKLVRGCVITGRITDEEGKPVIEERINLESLGEPSRIQMSSSYMNQQMYQTDDRGIYRIYGLPSGRYKVSVGSEAGGFARLGARGNFAQTFYGDTNDAGKAIVVELSEGAEASNIDIRLGRRGTTFSVAGRVVDSEKGEPVAGVRPMYGSISKANPGSGVFIGGLPTDQRGEFRFDGLEPGHYTISISSRVEGGDFYSEPIVFDIVDHDVTNLELKALRGLTLSGIVVPESDSSRDTLARFAGARIIAAINTASNPPAHSQGWGIIAPDGSFRITGLAPGRATIYIYSQENPNSRRFTQIRIERDGVEQPPEINLPAGQSISNLRVLVSYGTGVIRGMLKFENGTPPPNARAYVRIKKDGRNLEMGTTIDARGHFRMNDVPAGNYEVTLNLGFSAPLPAGQRPPEPPPKQFVTVADDTEAEVNFTINLSPKDGRP
jgi:protocatechuate 3,4-dioxygenase beta subunit